MVSSEHFNSITRHTRGKEIEVEEVIPCENRDKNDICDINTKRCWNMTGKCQDRI
jgi:hypothetical protein